MCLVSVDRRASSRHTTLSVFTLTLCCAPCLAPSRLVNAVCNAGTNTQMPTLQYTKEVRCNMLGSLLVHAEQTFNSYTCYDDATTGNCNSDQ